MNWFDRLPGFTRSAPGLEWAMWRRLPAILLWGTAIPLAFCAAAWFVAPDLNASAEDGPRLLMLYRVIGFVMLVWSFVLTLAIGCAIVIVMKGPAFVADPYPPPGREPEA